MHTERNSTTLSSLFTNVKWIHYVLVSILRFRLFFVYVHVLFHLKAWLFNDCSFFPDVWVQYDGMIIPSLEKSLLQPLSSRIGYDSYKMLSKTIKNIEFVAKYFFPKHFFECGFESGADMIHEVNMLYVGLKKSMLPGRENEKKYQSCIEKVLS